MVYFKFDTRQQADAAVIGARSDGGIPVLYDNKQCAFASIGFGLTDADVANLYIIVQRFQTILGRQV